MVNYMKSNNKFAFLLIIIAGIFWGSMGLFVRHLGAYGFSSIQIVALRLTVAAVAFAIVLAIKDKKGFRIKIKDIPLFLGLGLGSILFFTCCYFTAIRMLSMSTAAILLYTSPIWVMLMSVIFFKEKLTVRKIIELIMAFLGCVCISGFGGSVTLAGFMIGIGSGIGYGLYSILGAVALKRYSPYTVTAYTFIVAAIGAIIISRPTEIIDIVKNQPFVPGLIGFIILTGIVTAVIPFLCYTLGLERVEASRAAIFATVEPLVATVLGAIVYHETITIVSGTGIVLILVAIML